MFENKDQIMIVEDDPDLRMALEETLSLSGFESHLVESAESALIALDKVYPSIIVTDVQMAGMNGHHFLKNIKYRYPDLPVLMMTAYGTVNEAVEAMKHGAVDYLLKPFEAEVLVEKIKRYMVLISQKKNPIAADPSSQALFKLAAKVAMTNATVLISGESGTGKEVMARYIHDHSTRKETPFIAINCAAIPDSMLEAALFGHEKGAFTGAHQASPGKFEQAQGGTILLDEISEMPLLLQAKILRVLQEREVERLGGRKVIQLDVRVIATTNRSLWKEVKAGRFREDLYYRLNVFPLHWLPLSERPQDILPLADYLLTRHIARGHSEKPTLSPAAQEKLLAHRWHGNAREMDNIIQRALILHHDDIIEADDLKMESMDGLVDLKMDDGCHL